jgi:hypothetical protein
MNDTEADEVLMLMSQLWFKSSNIPEGTLKLWHTSLKSLQKTVAAKCINELTHQYPYWPAISEFRTHYQLLLRRDQMEIKAIEREYLPKEENLKRLREMRESLKGPEWDSEVSQQNEG